MQPGRRAPVEAPRNRAAAPSAGRRDHRYERDPAYPGRCQSLNLRAASEFYLRDLGSTCLYFLIYSIRLNSVNPLLPSSRHLKYFLYRNSRNNFQLLISLQHLTLFLSFLFEPSTWLRHFLRSSIA